MDSVNIPGMSRFTCSAHWSALLSSRSRRRLLKQHLITDTSVYNVVHLRVPACFVDTKAIRLASVYLSQQHPFLQDLCSRGPDGAAVDKDTFLRVFPLPGLLGGESLSLRIGRDSSLETSLVTRLTLQSNCSRFSTRTTKDYSHTTVF